MCHTSSGERKRAGASLLLSQVEEEQLLALIGQRPFGPFAVEVMLPLNADTSHTQQVSTNKHPQTPFHSLKALPSTYFFFVSCLNRHIATECSP